MAGWKRNDCCSRNSQTTSSRRIQSSSTRMEHWPNSTDPFVLAGLFRLRTREDEGPCEEKDEDDKAQQRRNQPHDSDNNNNNAVHHVATFLASLTVAEQNRPNSPLSPTCCAIAKKPGMRIDSAPMSMSTRPSSRIIIIKIIISIIRIVVAVTAISTPFCVVGIARCVSTRVAKATRIR